MPSLFSKFRHRKSNSTGGEANPSSPTSPRTPTSPQTPQRVNPSSTTASPTTPNYSRPSTDIAANADRNSAQATSPTPKDNHIRSGSVGNRSSVPIPKSSLVGREARRSSVDLNSPSRTSLDLTSKNRPGQGYTTPTRSVKNLPLPPGAAAADTDSPASPSRGIVRSPPFIDELDRPLLPTTTSNAQNPVPASGGDQSLFRSDHAASPPPPLPHVQSVDRSQIHDSEVNRPNPVITSSAKQPGSDAPSFPHVSSIPHSSSGDHLPDPPRSPVGPRPPPESVDRHALIHGTGSQLNPTSTIRDNFAGQSEIPTRSSALHSNQSGRFVADSAPVLPQIPTIPLIDTSAPTSSAQSPVLPIKPRSPVAPRSTWSPDQSPQEHITQHLQNLSISSVELQEKNKEEKKMLGGEFTNKSLEASRAELLEKIAVGANERALKRGELSEEGKRAFEAAGFTEEMGKTGTVEMHTKYVEPVIQEKIIRKEHVEYTTIIDREIHKYHVYPKIQPIHDPDPIKLQPLHRIFSPRDGKWHEVVGDAAAIEILGEEAFYGGKKEVREKRRIVLPGQGNGEVEFGTGREVVGETLITSQQEKEKRGEEELLAQGYGGRGTGRVMEREYVDGKETGKWKEVEDGKGWLKDVEPIGMAL